MKRILVTGGNGQLGSSIRKISTDYKEFAFTFIDYQELDLTASHAAKIYFEKHHPHYVINCAAYTAVDKAESDPENAFRINADIPALLSELAEPLDMKVIHISTDYVYNGSSSLPHKENEKLLPLSVYGKSKAAGEESLAGNELAMIVRTSWLYGEYGQNFMKTMVRLGGEKEEIGVVYDQAGSPTYSRDLAKALLAIIRYSEQKSFIPGIYNYANEGVCSWYDFAKEIMAMAGKKCRVKPILTNEYPLPAKRPEYSVLDKSKIKKTFGIEIPYWKDSLSTALANLKKNQEI
jgi:dTDP-4-dehydrorhamnose reductase